jgi:outer membrane biosynthesis protein TonB
VLSPTRPVIRPSQPPAASVEAPKRQGAGLGLAAVLGKPVVLTYSHLAIALVAIICLCAIVFVIGSRLFGPGGEVLPVTEKHPTFQDVQSGKVTPNLVAPGPARNAPLAPAPAPGPVGPGTVTPVPPWRPAAPAPVQRPGVAGKSPAAGPEKAVTPLPMPRPVAPEKVVGPEPTPAPAPVPAPAPAPAPPAPSGPQFRVRIALLPVAQPNIIDRMREFLSQKGVETELETHGGNYILYSRDRFPDKKKSDEAAAQINKYLAAFEKQTRIPTSNDAYSTQSKE